MNFYADKYAHYIVNRMLRLEEGEKLSINCNEDTLPFAHVVAHEAAETTGQSVSLVYIENGKVESVDEIDPSYQVKSDKGVAMLHLASFPSFDMDAELDAKALQEFRLLSDPIFLDRRISVPWATAYVPTTKWAEFVYGTGATTDKLWMDLADLLELEDEDSVDLTETLEKVLSLRAQKLNSLKAITLKLESSTCELTLPLALDYKATPSAAKLKNGRTFYPSLPCEDISVALDFTKANGHFDTTLPFRLFDRIFENASITIKDGEISGFSLEGGSGYINKFINIDKLSKNVGELILCDGMTHSSFFKKALGLPNYDRMRTTSIVFGGVNPEGITLEDEAALDGSKLNTSFARLELPLGSDSLKITAINQFGKESVIMEDGVFIGGF